MSDLAAISLQQTTRAIKAGTNPVSILWQHPESIAFVARGREHRSEFHVDPTDEVMFMIKGDMRLHYRTPDAEEKVALVKEGELIHCPAGTPHSPRFSPDSFVLVLERQRKPSEDDQFDWFCDRCGSTLYRAVRHVSDYAADPVSAVYSEFYADDEHLKCASCGHENPRPAA